MSLEGGHWYLPDGTPFYTVLCKSGANKGKERPVTLRDARAVNAVPSVTTVLGKWDKPALNTWRERNVFNATMAAVRAIEGQSPGCIFDQSDDDAFWRQVQEAAQEPTAVAADRGTQLHAAIENFLLGQPYDLSFRPHIEKVLAALGERGTPLSERDWKIEHSFAHKMGFGGKVDYHDFCGDGLIIDFKSKQRIDRKKRYGYINHRAQLGAYREGLLCRPLARGINVFVGVEDTEVAIVEWTPSDLKEGWNFFTHLLGAWKIDNHYYPKI